MAKKPKLMRAYRLKQETVWEIERLAEEWECTHGEVIERAVDRAGDAPSVRRAQKSTELKVEYDVE